MAVSRRTTLLALAAAAGALVLLHGRSERRGAPVVQPDGPAPQPGAGWADMDAPRRIRQLAVPIEDLVGWPGLGDYLASVAWTESRGNSAACHGACVSNSARGWFQLRPNSARLGDLGLPKSALFDEPTAVALAAWYAHRLRPFAGPGQTIDWLALRRGWAYPSRVKDVEETHQRSRETRERFERGVAKAGLSDSFMYEPAFPAGYAWPGIEAVLQAVGRDAGNAVA